MQEFVKTKFGDLSVTRIWKLPKLGCFLCFGGSDSGCFIFSCFFKLDFTLFLSFNSDQTLKKQDLV